MPPRRFKPAPTDADKYDGQIEPNTRIEDYLQNIVVLKGNEIAAMQCFQLYLKDSARAWLRSLPRGKIRTWDDLVDTFVKNFQATYKRPVGIEELKQCVQKPKESMRSYLSLMWAPPSGYPILGSPVWIADGPRQGLHEAKAQDQQDPKAQQARGADRHRHQPITCRARLS